MNFILGCVLSNVQEYGFRNAGQQVGAYSCTPLQLAEQFRLRFRYLGPLSLLTRLAESFCRSFPFDLTFSADTLQQHAGGFVLRVLGYEFALEGALEDRLTQPLLVGLRAQWERNALTFVSYRTTPLTGLDALA